MKNSLSDKISQVKDEHAAEIVDKRADQYREHATNEALFFLGRIRQNEHLAVAISTNLTAQTIRALEHFQQEDGYKTLGYNTFVDFLEKSEYSPMSKRQYYDRLALIRDHGDEIYDLLTSVGISVRAQKMLGHGDLAIKDDQLFIGDKAVSMADSGIIKDVLNEMFDEKRTLIADREKLQKQNESLKNTITTGADEYHELQRNFDVLRSGNPHDRVVAHAIQSLLELTESAGQLDDKAKAAKGKDNVQTLFSVILKVRDAYGISTPLSDVSIPSTASTPSTDFDSKLAAEISADDDLDLEEDID